MEYIAIQRKKDGAFVSGSDFRYYPPHSIMSNKYRPPLLFPNDEEFYSLELFRRKINLKNYRLVKVTIKEISE